MANKETNGAANADGIELTNLKELPSRQESRAGNRHSLVELHVCLPDLSHVTLMIDQRTQATEIMDTIIETLQLNPQEARRVLSLWLASADLELQLKPNHCPTQLFSKWPTYLRKYTALSDKSLTAQKPLVHLRRNVYISREEDLQVTDIEILELLFTEARCNIMDGTYPCNRDLVINLAGILCAMQYGDYNEEHHTTEFYKSHYSVLPLSIQNNSKSKADFCSLLSLAHLSASRIDRGLSVAHSESRSDHWFKAAYQCYLEEIHSLPYYGSNQAALFPVSALTSDAKPLIEGLMNLPMNLPETASTSDLQTIYLTECCDKIPYYGSVFFDGYVERVQKKMLGSSWLPVSIGANTDGIYIIDTEKQEPLLGILYEDLTWQYVDICACNTTSCPHSTMTGDGHQKSRGISMKSKSGVSKDKVNSMPSLLLQYPANQEEKHDNVDFQVLQVFTMSARLIDAFIENCSEMLKQRVYSSPIPSPGIMLAAAGISLVSPPDNPADGGDVVDGPKPISPHRQSSVTESRTNRENLEKSIRGLMKPNKLMCQSFSKDGKCVSV